MARIPAAAQQAVANRRMTQTAINGSGAATPYSQNRVDSDGTFYLQRIGSEALGGASGATAFTLSVWLNVENPWPGTLFLFDQDRGSSSLRLFLNASRQLNLSEAPFSGFTTTSALPYSWAHLMVAGQQGTGVDVYINGVAAVTRQTWASGTMDLDLTSNICRVLARDNGLQAYSGGIADLWMDDAYYDPTNAAQLAKFIDAEGAPVDLGSDGSAPGAQPFLFLGAAHTATNWNAGTNLGSGDNLTKLGNDVANV